MAGRPLAATVAIQTGNLFVSVTIAIPARLGSQRLPRKVLADLNGHPLLWHVWAAACRCPSADEVVIVADGDEVLKAAESWGALCVPSDRACRSGTARIASVLPQLRGDFVINLQADEPLMPPAVLEQLIEHWQGTGGPIVTPVHALQDVRQLDDPNLVKVVRANDGTALYFSRAAIPHVRDGSPQRWLGCGLFWGHIGVYGFSRAWLEAFDALPDSPLEDAECLEQLRWLDAGTTIRAVVTDYQPAAVDTQEDLDAVRALLAERCEARQ